MWQPSWPGADTPALFPNRRGGRLPTRAVDQLMDELATNADIIDEAGTLALSTHIYGHARPDTIRCYALPTDQ